MVNFWKLKTVQTRTRAISWRQNSLSGCQISWKVYAKQSVSLTYCSMRYHLSQRRFPLWKVLFVLLRAFVTWSLIAFETRLRRFIGLFVSHLSWNYPEMLMAHWNCRVLRESLALRLSFSATWPLWRHKSHQLLCRHPKFQVFFGRRSESYALCDTLKSDGCKQSQWLWRTRLKSFTERIDASPIWYFGDKFVFHYGQVGLLVWEVSLVLEDICLI